MHQTFITSISDELAYLKQRLAAAKAAEQKHLAHVEVQRLTALSLGRKFSPPDDGGTASSALRNLEVDFRNLERLALANDDLAEAKLSEAKAARADEKTAKTKAKLQTELQGAISDQSQAIAVLRGAEADMRAGQAQAYRGKCADLQSLEANYSNAVDRAATLDSAISAIESELAALPVSTVKEARASLDIAAQRVRDFDQWHADRLAAVAVFEAFLAFGSPWGGFSGYTDRSNFSQHFQSVHVQHKCEGKVTHTKTEPANDLAGNSLVTPDDVDQESQAA